MMRISKTGWWMIGGAGMGVLSIGAFFALSKKKSAAAKAAEATLSDIGKGIRVRTGSIGRTKSEPNWNAPFNMNYIKDVQGWIAPKTLPVLSPARARTFAKAIKNAKGRFNDDETAIETVFGKHLQDKTQVASVSKAFYEMYKKDLWQHLNSFLNQSEMKRYVLNYVRRLPNYSN